MGAVERAGTELARRTSRRSFLGRLGRTVVAIAGGSMVAVALEPDRAEAHHICGTPYTTGLVPPSRTRRTRGRTPTASRCIPRFGYPVDDEGAIYLSERQTRRKVCQTVVPERFPFVRNPRYGGGWSRCCNGRVRHIQDCCSTSEIRINGDGSVTRLLPARSAGSSASPTGS